MKSTEPYSWKGAIACIAYGVAGLSMTIFEEYVFSYEFKGSFTLACGQCFFSLMFLLLLKKLKWFDFEKFEYNKVPQLTWLIVNFIGMVATGILALEFVSLSMYSTLRRGSTLLTLAGESLILSRAISLDEKISVYGMVIGGMIAGAGDLQFDFFGYLLIFFNCLFMAGYLINIKLAKDRTGISTFGLLFYNNLCALPLFLLLALFTEYSYVSTFEYLYNPGFIFSFFMSSILAFLLNYCVFLCSTITSPLTTSIMSQIKSLITTGLGLFTFGGIILTAEMGLGLLVSTIATVWYILIKHKQKQAYVKRIKEQVREANAPSEGINDYISQMMGESGTDNTKL